MGTQEECEIMADKFLSLRQNNISVETSVLYANRAPSNLYRLYVEINCPKGNIKQILLK